MLYEIFLKGGEKYENEKLIDIILEIISPQLHDEEKNFDSFIQKINSLGFNDKLVDIISFKKIQKDIIDENYLKFPLINLMFYFGLFAINDIFFELANVVKSFDILKINNHLAVQGFLNIMNNSLNSENSI